MLFVKILRKVWRFQFVAKIDSKDSRGECDPPTKRDRGIRIRSDLKGVERLEVILHEIMHAGDFKLPERFVSDFCNDAAQIITDLGYRDGQE